MAVKKFALKARAMTIDEFSAYLEESEKAEAEVKNQTRRVFRLAQWVLKNVYKVDVHEAEGVTPGTLFDILVRTQRMSEQSQLDELKN
uniref:hypothetical protein n=1 Tax=uncultured Allisonella sp. TaxID=339338 RepID=UPI002805E4EE|nr:hypothetical protein [uncultured Allisonella sp.]